MFGDTRQTDLSISEKADLLEGFSHRTVSRVVHRMVKNTKKHYVRNCSVDVNGLLIKEVKIR